MINEAKLADTPKRDYMKDNLKQQKGIGGILIIVGVIFVIAVIVMAFFLFNGSTKQEAPKPEASQNQTESTTVNESQVPLKICETGDPEQCDDPVSNSDVDNVTNIEDEYP
jgi:cytoskeletal protein RodZ